MRLSKTILVVLVMLMGIFLVPSVPPVHANPGLSVDVSRAVYCTDASSFTNTCSITDTVSSKGELMFVFVGIMNFLSTTPGVFTIVDTQGDTFTARNYTLPVYTQTHQAFREYVATSSSASSGSITVNSTRVFQWTMFFVAIKGNSLLLDCAVGSICNPSTGIAGPGGGTNPQSIIERYMHGPTMFIQALNLHNVNTGTTIFSSTCANNGCIVGAQVQKITTPCCVGSGPEMKGAIQTSSQQVANPGMSWNSTENYVGVINDAVYETNNNTQDLIIDTWTGADQQGSTKCGNTQPTCTTYQFSTSSGNERLIVFGMNKNPTGIMNITDTAGLTWIKQTSDITVGTNVKMASWTAAIGGSPLVNDRVTLFLGAGSGSSLIEIVTIRGNAGNVNIRSEPPVITTHCTTTTSCATPPITYTNSHMMMIQGLSTDDLAGHQVATNCGASACVELVQNNWNTTVRESEQWSVNQVSTPGYTESPTGPNESFELITEVLYAFTPSTATNTANTILLRDDFNTQTPGVRQANPNVDSAWDEDIYYNVNSGPGSSPGLWTFNNYLNLRTSTDPTTKTVPMIESTHPTTPAWYSSDNVTPVTRQLTAALLPFDYKDSANNAWIRIGFAPLIQSGIYPTTTPSPFRGVTGNANVDANQDCGTVANPNMSGKIQDFYGIEYLDIGDKGDVYAVSCGHQGFQRTFMGNVNPLTYSTIVVTYCCGVQQTWWVYYSITQQTGLDATKIDSPEHFTFGTPLTLNVTDATKIDPYYQTNYMFISQFINPAASAQYITSRVDMIQLQSYQSGVSLERSATLCVYNCGRTPPHVATAQDSIYGIGDVFQVGEPAGVVIFFFVLSIISMAGTAWATQNKVPTIMVGALILGVFVYSNAFPTWLIMLPVLMTALTATAVIRFIIFGKKSSVL